MRKFLVEVGVLIRTLPTPDLTSMSNFRLIDRETGFLLPPSVDEWLPERENRELRQANEILRKASAYFAQAELDRPFKR